MILLYWCCDKDLIYRKVYVMSLLFFSLLTQCVCHNIIIILNCYKEYVERETETYYIHSRVRPISVMGNVVHLHQEKMK